jgi:hypothetical protein
MYRENFAVGILNMTSVFSFDSHVSFPHIKNGSNFVNLVLLLKCCNIQI